jgi:hypothetical protein
MWKDGQTYDEANSRFSHFCKPAAKNPTKMRLPAGEYFSFF